MVGVAPPDPANPFGMDETCTHCPELVETRSRVLHGYGDPSADFVIVGGAPDPDADHIGLPILGETHGDRLRAVLEAVGLCDPDSPADAPGLTETYLTYTARCHHPDRGPTDTEVANCDPFLNADLRMINPEVLIPVGELALSALDGPYASTAGLDIDDVHAERVRGRGFELVPVYALDRLDTSARATTIETLEELMAGDYRQTKGRRSR